MPIPACIAQLIRIIQCGQYMSFWSVADMPNNHFFDPCTVAPPEVSCPILL